MTIYLAQVLSHNRYFNLTTNPMTAEDAAKLAASYSARYSMVTRVVATGSEIVLASFGEVKHPTHILAQ